MEEEKIIEERKQKILTFLKKDKLISLFIILTAISFIFAFLSIIPFLRNISFSPIVIFMSTISSVSAFGWFLLGILSSLSIILCLHKKEKYIFYPLLAWIVWLTIKIRTLPLEINPATGKPGLWDITRNAYTLGPDLDPFLFLRWTKDIVSQGALYAIDTMRYVPLGFNVKEELVLHTYLMAWFHKIASSFGSPSVEYSSIIYPVFMFALTIIAFFFFVRKLFSDTLGKTYSNFIALFASFLLSVIPAILPRTVAGIPEKEASGFLFLFMAFYFFLCSWKSNTEKAPYVYSILAALSTSFMALVWGGYIYIYLTIALATGISFIIGQTNRKHFYIYSIWLFISILVTTFSTQRFSLSGFLTSSTTGISIAVFGVMFIHYLISHNELPHLRNHLQKTKLKDTPLQIISIGIILILGILSSFIISPSFLTDKFESLKNQLVTPTSDRLGVTVAENRQPYFDEWANSFGPPLSSFVQYITFNAISLPSLMQKFSNIPLFFWLIIFSSIYLFFYFTNNFQLKERLILVFGYTIFLLGIIFSRYKPGHLLDGTNPMSLFVYSFGLFSLFFVLGKKGQQEDDIFNYYKYSAIALFMLFIWINYFPSNLIFTIITFISLSYFGYFALLGLSRQENLKSLDWGILLIFSFLFLSIVSARGAVRLIMMLGPPSAILISATIGIMVKNIITTKSDSKKTISLILLIIVIPAVLFSAYAFFESTKAQARSQIPYSYTFQWQKAMSWVRENTPQNAVFGHWWDYGYWLQSIGERATVLDGGNAIPYWNYLMGRHALTGPDNQVALDYLYTHNATHFLIDSTDIGKYSAFSSIGSDLKSDRASFIQSMQRNNQLTKELKNGTELFYFPTGNKYENIIPLDQDITYENNGTKLNLLAGNAVLVGISIESDLSGRIKGQPNGIFVYIKNNGQQVEESFPLRYAFYNGTFKDFGSGIESGAYFMQRINEQGSGSFNLEIDGSLLYLSKKTVKSQLARLYLYKEKNPYFKLVHTQDSPIVEQSKLSGASQIEDVVFYGGIQGPIRIWEINYPNNMTINQTYLSKTFQDTRLAR